MGVWGWAAWVAGYLIVALALGMALGKRIHWAEVREFEQRRRLHERLRQLTELREALERQEQDR